MVTLSALDAVTAILHGDTEFQACPDRFYQAAAAAPAIVRLDDDGPWLCCSYSVASGILADGSGYRMQVDGSTTRREVISMRSHWVELLDGGVHRTNRQLLQAAMSSTTIDAAVESALAGTWPVPRRCDLVGDVFELFWKRFQPSWVGLDAEVLDRLTDHIPALLTVVMNLDPDESTEQTAVDAVALLADAIRRHDRFARGVVGELISGGVPSGQVAVHVANLIVDMSVGTAGLGVCAARLLDDPNARSHARDDLLSTLDECLRLDPPQTLLIRMTAEDRAIEDIAMPGGEHIAVLVGVANRDPAQFVSSGVFRPGRPVPPLTFGLGPHSCLGRRLFQRVATALIGELLDQYPRVVRSGESTHTAQVGIRSIESLPVRLW